MNECNSKNAIEALITYILSMLDLACTLYWMHVGVGELNPLLQDERLMVFYKIVIVGPMLLFLASRKEPIAKWGIRICMAAYVAVSIWHLIGAVMIYTLI